MGIFSYANCFNGFQSYIIFILRLHAHYSNNRLDWKALYHFLFMNVVFLERNMILPIAVNQTNWVTNPFRVTRLSIWWCTYTKLQILNLHFMLLLINLQLPYLHSSPFTFKVVFMWLCVCVYLYLCVCMPL